MQVRLLITGRMYHPAAELPEQWELPEQSDVAHLLRDMAQAAGAAGLPGTCLVAVNGVHLGTLDSHTNQPLHDGDEVALITPVAGG